MVDRYWYSDFMKKTSIVITTLKLFIYRQINNLIKSKYFFGILYRLYFGFLGYIRQGFWVNLSRERGFYVIHENFKNDEKIKWVFPVSMRLRCLKIYHDGLINRGKQLAEIYNINKINFKEDDIIIDCGSNLSDLLLYLGKLDIELTYHSIEPGEEEYKANKLNLTRHNFPKIEKYCHKYALGDKNEIRTFYYEPESANSSLIKTNEFKSAYDLNVITIDYFSKIQNISNKKIKLLKLEAEGFEPEILEGSAIFLSNIEFIAADVGPERGLNKECTLAQVTTILSKNNFEMIYFGYPARITALYRNKKYHEV